MTTISSNDQDESPSAQKQCFTPIQSRRYLWAPAVNAVTQLCPSMDLMVLGVDANSTSSSDATTTTTMASRNTAASSQQLLLYRTLSWQKLAAMHPSSNDVANEEASTVSFTNARYSPDGRRLAVADTAGFVTLVPVENVLSNASHHGALGHDDHDQLDDDDDDFLHHHGGASTKRIQMHTPAGTTITALYWTHASKLHSAWEASEEELQLNTAWGYQKQFLEEQQRKLPPSEYHNRFFARNQTEYSSLLSVLAVATSDGSLSLYLNGQYPIAQGLFLGQTPTTSALSLPISSMIASPDLTTMIVRRSDMMALEFVRLPALAPQYSTTLQCIATLYANITSHHHIVQNGLTAIAASVKSSIKALDLKLDALVKLFRNYNLIHSEENIADSIRRYLLQYITFGSTAGDGSLNNAMDQFFTSVQMNDQLLVRLQASLTVAAANVEKAMRKKLIAPAQALLQQVYQLRAMSMAADCSGLHQTGCTCASMVPRNVSDLVKYSEELFFLSELAWTRWIETRFRLRDILDWLRSAGSQVKARGTAANSVQRDNAKKRRVPDATVHRIIQYLATTKHREHTQQPIKLNPGSSLTEAVFGIRFHDEFFSSEETELGKQSRPESPRSTVLWKDKISSSLVNSVAKLADAIHVVFECPRQSFAQATSSVNLQLSDASDKTTRLMVFTTRLGYGGARTKSTTARLYGVPAPTGFFCPVADHDDEDASRYRQWALIATAASDENQMSFVSLHAIPLQWVGYDDEKDELNSPSSLASTLYWSVTLAFPVDDSFEVLDMAFYGDDGKSSLSSGSDGGSGKEDRQALALLVRRRQHAHDTADELWMLPYETLRFEKHDIQRDSDMHTFALASPKKPAHRPTVQIRPLCVNNEEENIDENIVFARARVIGSGEAARGRRSLCVSGSRGVVAIISEQANGVAAVLDLLDVEEDEEEEEAAEEEEEEEQEVDEDMEEED